MFGSSFDFSSVTLPGAGGGINASNAISGKKLKKQNKDGPVWTSGAAEHNEEILKKNAEHREKREGLVNREYNENADGKSAMDEIFARKKARMSSYKEMKKGEYGFSESQDTELLSMPLPGFKEKCSCNHCPSCVDSKHKEMEYREWSTEKRKALQSGKIKGSFAGPDMSFPIASPVDVAAAWSSVGRAPNPRAVMKSIISIAKKHGWESGLPASVKKRLAAGESGLPSD
jgi:hypothetical protein